VKRTVAAANGFTLLCLGARRASTGIGNVFKTRNEVLFMAWGYDLSGEPPSLRPGKDSEIVLTRIGDDERAGRPRRGSDHLVTS
jgi:hypothetical protein